MRKLIILITAMLLVGGVVFGQGMWKDGTYTAEGSSFDHGWKNMVRIVVEDGYIVDAHFDAIPEGGGKYKYLASVQGEYGMVANSDAEEYWYTQVDRAAQYLLEEQDPGRIVRRGQNVDALSGVSVTIMPHFELAQRALRNARR
jgi:major membrane immunogen (membrane-anchored lipoprotein)